MYLIKCPICGKIFKCTKVQDKYITDYGDDITTLCLCGKEREPIVIKTEPWIAELVFKIKGK